MNITSSDPCSINPFHRAGDYSRQDLVEGFKEVGLNRGDVSFVIVGLAALGKAEGCFNSEQVCHCLLSALREVLGVEGTILVPTYTFSFCKGEVYDVQNTPTPGGPWSPFSEFLEYFRKQSGAVRSGDPIHSVAGLGPRVGEILHNAAPTCFGEDSFYHRLRRMQGKICAIGLGLHESNLAHHAEEMIGVPFRFKKLFTGCITDNGISYRKGWVYNVGILAKNGQLDEFRLEKKARDAGLCKATRVGLGEILGINSQDLFELAFQALAKDSWFTAQGPADDPVKLEDARVAAPGYTVNLPRNASMVAMLDVLRKLPRDAVSEGYDTALAALAAQTPMKIHEYASGTECWSWIIPEKWTCHEAYLESLDGHRYFSYADNPLHVVSYSLPFDGKVSRKELFEHLHVHDEIPESIPFISKCYERDWGLCCNKLLRDKLTDGAYRVVIKSDFSFGKLKIGEMITRGKSDKAIILCARLCHSTMVNDGLSGVLVGILVMQQLAKRSNLRYAYRLLIVPENIGSVAYLSHNESLIARMKGGLCLGALDLDHPHALQFSFGGSSEVDICFALALNENDPCGWAGAYGQITSGDERQFNAPGICVPMLSLSRVLPAKVGDSPYREHHSFCDNPDATSATQLEKSAELILRMIDTLEQNYVPVNKFKGQLFCSRYGLAANPSENPASNRIHLRILDLVDGTCSIAQIARKCGISFDATKAIMDELFRLGLVDYQ